MQTNLQIGAPLNCDPNPRLQWIEVASSLQIPSFHIVGLPGPEVAEARERVRAAIEASGLQFPRRRVVLNLSPANIRKQGTSTDLAMALAVLSAAKSKNRRNQASNPIPNPNPTHRLIACGELGLDGSVKQAGQLTRALYAAWQAGASFLMVPKAEYEHAIKSAKLISKSGELNHLPTPKLIAVATLSEAWHFVNTGTPAPLTDISTPESDEAEHAAQSANGSSHDNRLLMSVSPFLGRALGVAAAGSHHMLLLGPKGSGKSHAIEWLIALLPPTPYSIALRRTLLAEIIETNTPSNKLSTYKITTPIRRISPQVRPAALLGSVNSSSVVRPGEFSLAHGGLLIADELLEWARDSREALREPLERGSITLTRCNGSVELPARFLLAANGNFCPCGGWPKTMPLPTPTPQHANPVTRCRCSTKVQDSYLSRLSGPILDRIDIMARVDTSNQQMASNNGSGFKELKQNVDRAFSLAYSRWGKPAGWLEAQELEALLERHQILKNERALSTQPSLRSRHKILRLALTLSCWDGASEPSPAHFVEATRYRPEFNLNLTYLTN